MSGYTPGPWIAGDDEGSDYYLVGPHDGDGLVYQSAVKLHTEPNTRLIAAAPDLLAALQALVAELDGPGKPYSSDSYAPPHFIETARAAIAKATNGDSK